MVLTIVTNLPYSVFLTTSLSTILLNLLKSARTVFGLFISILFIWAFKLAKSDFAAKLYVLTLVGPFKTAFFA